MKNTVNFQKGMDIDPNDHNSVQDYVKSTIDDLSFDAIASTSRYAGFQVAKTTSNTEITVEIGRLYVSGSMYESQEIEEEDFVLSLPTIGSKYVSVFVNKDEIDTDNTPREFLVDEDTGASQPKTVALTHKRIAKVSFTHGQESPNPVPPGTQAGYTKVADVLLTKDGVGAITMNPATLMPNLGTLQDRVGVLEDFRETIEPKVASITSDLTRITGELANIGDKGLAFALAADVADIKVRLDISDDNVGYRADNFISTLYSNTAGYNYLAKVEEGLRFPPEAGDVVTLDQANPFATDVKRSSGGMLLPAYNEIITRVVKGGVGQMALSQYQFETRTATILTEARSRVRYGDEFEVSTGSALYLSGSYQGGFDASGGAVSVLTIKGETFQQYDTGRLDPDGHKIVRLSKFWTDSTGSPYWSRLTSSQPISGFAWYETFVQQGDGWMTALSARVSQKPAFGLLYVGLCQCDNGVPNLDKTLAMVSADASFFAAQGGLGTNKLPIPPTFLEGGQRYAYVLMTQYDFWVQVVETGTSPTTGTMFYSLGGGVLQSDANRHIMFDAWYASFTQNRVVVDLKNLALSGGIASIDILADCIVPKSTSLVYRVQIGGIWYDLTETNDSFLRSLPSTLPFQAVFTGSSDVMPGLKLGKSAATISRPGKVIKHLATEKVLTAPSSTIVTKSKIRNFDPLHHAHTTKILVGTGYATVETADVVQDVLRGSVLERTCTFNLAAPTTKFVRQIDATTDSAVNLFVTDSQFDIAE